MKEETLTGLIAFILITAIFVGGFWFLSHNNEESKNAETTQTNMPHQNVRSPAVAGTFYPADKNELTKAVDEFLARAQKIPPSPPFIKGGENVILGLVVPHAGYTYSGQVAAWGFKQLVDQNIDTVILIGNSHRAYFSGAAIYDKGYFKTPLGEVEVDAELAGKIMAENKNIKADMAAQASEHSLEVEVPFLQRVLPNFKIVPILMGNGDLEDVNPVREPCSLTVCADGNFKPPAVFSNGVKMLAQAISKNIAGQNVLVVASSDMSHYPPYERANYADKKTYEAILTGQVDKLESAIAQLEKENIANTQTFLCAKDAVEVLMMVMQNLGASDIKLLKYANSGDTTGDKNQVVGYGAIGFYGERSGGELSQAEQQRLLEIVRQSVEAYVKTGQAPAFSENSAALNQKLGVFVTIKKGGQLRGCIGNFPPQEAGQTPDSNLLLWQNVVKMAIAAATQDPRFSPVSADELNDLEYEVSVLSPLQKIDDWHEIQLGKHGVEIKKGNHNGVFLPQVATETGWDLDTFMGQLCSQKAGLPWDCWKDKETEIYTFTAQVF